MYKELSSSSSKIQTRNYNICLCHKDTIVPRDLNRICLFQAVSQSPSILQELQRQFHSLVTLFVMERYQVRSNSCISLDSTCEFIWCDRIDGLCEIGEAGIFWVPAYPPVAVKEGIILYRRVVVDCPPPPSDMQWCDKFTAYWWRQVRW